MLDFREMRSKIKGHGALHLFKWKTSEKYEKKLNLHEIEKKIPNFYKLFQLLILYWYKTAGHFFMLELKIFRRMFYCDLYDYRMII